MAKNILVATPLPALGELLRLSLEESGRYNVRLAATGREALASADQTHFALAVLDSSLADPPLAYVAQGLRNRQKELRLIVIPPGQGHAPIDLGPVRPDEIIFQPIYPPELLETADKLTRESESPHSTTAPASPSQPVVSNPVLIARRLEEFLLESTSPGAMVIRLNQPWAFAGELSAQACQEIAILLAGYLESGKEVDMARFVHLNALGGEYLLYATPLSAELVLALVFHVTTPLTVIRAQAARLVRTLRQTDGSPQFSVITPVESIGIFESQELNDDEGEDETPDFDTRRLDELLSNMPDPNPPPLVKQEPAGWVQVTLTGSAAHPEFQNPRAAEATQPAASPARTMSSQTSAPNQTAVQAPKSQGQSVPPVPHLPIASSHPSPALPVSAPLPEITVDAGGELTEPVAADLAATLPAQMPEASLPPKLDAETQPVVLRKLHSLSQAEPLTSVFSNLAYTCVLIPRLPGHILVDGAAENLAAWLPQLCMAYGWRLEGLLIRPEYLQWTVHVAPSLSPNNVIRLIRQQTSRRIFAHCPKYQEENPSGDFWAPGYLIISGFQLPSPALVHDFIHQIRRRQGNDFQ